MRNRTQTIQAINYLNEYSPQIIERVKNILDPFIGRDIFKVDGSLKKIVPYTSERISKEVPGGWLTVDYWLRKSYNYVEIRIKICYNGGSYEVKPSTSFCIYQEQAFTIYTLTDNLLTSFEDKADREPQYNESQLTVQANIITEKVKELNKLIEGFPYRLRSVFDVPNHIRS